ARSFGAGGGPRARTRNRQDLGWRRTGPAPGPGRAPAGRRTARAREGRQGALRSRLERRGAGRTICQRQPAAHAAQRSVARRPRVVRMAGRHAARLSPWTVSRKRLVSARSTARGHNRAPVAPPAAVAKETLLAPGKAFRPA